MWVEVITAQTVVFVSLSDGVTDPVRQFRFRFLWVMQRVLKQNGKHYFISSHHMRSRHCHRLTSHQSDSSPSQQPADEAVTALHTVTHPTLMGRLFSSAPTDNLILRATWQTATQLIQERLNYLRGSPLSSLNMSTGVFKLLKQKQLQEIIMRATWEKEFLGNVICVCLFKYVNYTFKPQIVYRIHLKAKILLCTKFSSVSSGFPLFRVRVDAKKHKALHNHFEKDRWVFFLSVFNAFKSLITKTGV